MYANTLESLLAKQDITDCLARYARGVDRGDAELLNSCYFDDSIEEHGSSFTGNARDYVAGAMKRLAKAGVMAHYLCNAHIELDGGANFSRAWVESYLLTFARFGTVDAPVDTLTGGRVVDRFERRAGEWRIAHRKMAFDWNHDMPTNEAWCQGLFKPDDPRMIMGTRGHADLSYSRF